MCMEMTGDSLEKKSCFIKERLDIEMHVHIYTKKNFDW